MKTILITPKNKEEYALITALLKKMDIPNTILTNEQKENIGMAILIKKADNTKTVSRNTIMKKLK
ncbi:hypothetical protein C7N43_38105 [Sphingobacteriales bacterium UPWRP_1]|nr:hypothetical protein B6N25_06640 [Sphingobacteriales bacterium TSM_CSS]PSJ71666.1 hypothetical protein C7N43_38105 [Sphingobacteriales bacterium UPWRP_1]